jgi:hypothetical protein
MAWPWGTTMSDNSRDKSKRKIHYTNEELRSLDEVTWGRAQPSVMMNKLADAVEAQASTILTSDETRAVLATLTAFSVLFDMLGIKLGEQAAAKLTNAATTVSQEQMLILAGIDIPYDLYPSTEVANDNNLPPGAN